MWRNHVEILIKGQKPAEEVWGRVREAASLASFQLMRKLLLARGLAWSSEALNWSLKLVAWTLSASINALAEKAGSIGPWPPVRRRQGRVLGQRDCPGRDAAFRRSG